MPQGKEGNKLATTYSESRATQEVAIPMLWSSSKNQWSISPSGHMYLDAKAKKERLALVTYLKQMMPIEPEFSVGCEMDVNVSERVVIVRMFTTGLYDGLKCPDADGMLTALLDAAQPSRYRGGRITRLGAGILTNDNRVKQLKVVVK